MKILFAKIGEPTENDSPIKKLSVDITELEINWNGDKKTIKKINFIWNQEAHLPDKIRFKFLKREGERFFELSFDENNRMFFYLAGDELNVNFFDGKDEKINSISLKESHKEIDIKIPAEKCQVEGNNVVANLGESWVFCNENEPDFTELDLSFFSVWV